MRIRAAHGTRAFPSSQHAPLGHGDITILLVNAAIVTLAEDLAALMDIYIDARTKVTG